MSGRQRGELELASSPPVNSRLLVCISFRRAAVVARGVEDADQSGFSGARFKLGLFLLSQVAGGLCSRRDNRLFMFVLFLLSRRYGRICTITSIVSLVLNGIIMLSVVSGEYGAITSCSWEY